MLSESIGISRVHRFSVSGDLYWARRSLRSKKKEDVMLQSGNNKSVSKTFKMLAASIGISHVGRL
jgi:hypothetical protein